MAGRSLSEALKEIGHSEGAHTRSPVLRTSKGTLITFGRFSEGKAIVWVGVRIGPAGAELVGDPPRSTGHGAMMGLSGAAATLVDLFLDATRTYLERVEQLDAEIADVQSKGPDVPLASVWHLREHSAKLRAHVDRALVAAAE